jgi:hypothetical protein
MIHAFHFLCTNQLLVWIRAQARRKMTSKDGCRFLAGAKFIARVWQLSEIYSPFKRLFSDHMLMLLDLKNLNLEDMRAGAASVSARWSRIAIDGTGRR